MAQLNFDSTQVQPYQGNEAIPAGWYLATAVQSDVKQTEKKTGFYLEIVFEIIEGQFKGSRVFARLNISNPNETAQRIGQGQLSAICKAVNIPYLQDSQQLHSLPIKIKVKYNEAEGKYDASNDIVSFQNANYVPPVANAGQATATQELIFPQQSAPVNSAPQLQFPAAPASQAVPVYQAPASAIPAAQPFNPAAAPAQPWANPAAPQQAPVAAMPAQAPIQPANAAPAQELPAWANQQAAAPAPQPVATQAAPTDTQVLPPWMQQAQ